MSCDVVEVTKRLENELCSTVYSSAHSPNFLSLHLRHLRHNNVCLFYDLLEDQTQTFIVFHGSSCETQTHAAAGRANLEPFELFGG